MREDIRTVMWKESKALLRPRGSRLRGAMLLATPALLMILLPIQIGEDFLRTPFVLLLTIVISMLVVGTTIPESFAGERERHTLPTLLASRLSDRAILLGKLLVPILFAWGVLAFGHLAALIVFNIAHWSGSFRLHPPTVGLAILGLGLLLPVIGAGLGVIISLRASSVQQAEQLLMMFLLIPIFLLQIAGAVVFASGEERARDFIEFLEGLNWELVLTAVLLVLVVSAAVVTWLADNRFHRGRLILSD